MLQNTIRDKKDRIGRHIIFNIWIIGVPKGLNQNSIIEKIFKDIRQEDIP